MKEKKNENEYTPFEDEKEMGNEVQKEKEEEEESDEVISYENENKLPVILVNLENGEAYNLMNQNVRRSKYNGETVAAKFLPEKERKDEKAIQRLKHSAWLLSKVKSPHVVGFKAVVHDANRGIAVLMEDVPGSTLKSFISTRSFCYEGKKYNANLTDDQKVQMAKDLAFGFKAIHQGGMKQYGLVRTVM